MFAQKLISGMVRTVNLIDDFEELLEQLENEDVSVNVTDIVLEKLDLKPSTLELAEAIADEVIRQDQNTYRGKEITVTTMAPEIFVVSIAFLTYE